MPDTIRILIASDYCLTRTSLRQLLKQVSELQVVAETDMPKDLADAQFRHSPDATVLAARVLGYVLRKASENDLFLAIRSACQGRRFRDPLLSDSLADVLLGRIPPDVRSGEVRLSPRELQVLRGVVCGFTSRELARTARANG